MTTRYAIKPGSVVWFYSGKYKKPLMGIVIRVWNLREANIRVLLDNGKHITMFSVRIVYEGDPLPRWGYCYAKVEYPIGPPLLKGSSSHEDLT